MLTLGLSGILRVENVASVQPGQELLLDMSRVTFSYPSGLVAVACLGLDAAELEVVWPHDEDQQRYMSRMHIDRLLQAKHGNLAVLPQVRHHAAELCEAVLFSDTGDVDRLADLVRTYADGARIPADWAWALEEGVWEICVNAITHSEWGGGVMAAQHYQQRAEIEYGVADAGIGVRSSMVGEYPELADDAEAILKAREYGTTRFGQDQRGAGLSETVDQVTALGGQVVIRSGSALVTFRRTGPTTRFTDEPWRGTLVKVVLPLP